MNIREKPGFQGWVNERNLKKVGKFQEVNLKKNHISLTYNIKIFL